jgi:hypothetical protein
MEAIAEVPETDFVIRLQITLILDGLAAIAQKAPFL